MPFFDHDWFDFVLSTNAAPEYEAVLVGILSTVLVLGLPVGWFY